MQSRDLIIRAGPAALARIRERGFGVEDVRAVAGAAGGPKWLVLSAIDHFVFGKWLQRAARPVDLVGASIGAWRFSAACAADPASAISTLETAYVEQAYGHRPSRGEISAVIRGVLERFFDASVLEGVLAHPRWRLTVITARSRAPTASERRWLLGAGAAAGAVANGLRRNWIGGFFERVLFHSPGAAPAEFVADGIATRHVPLSRANARDAVYASGSIPMMMEGLRDPSGAPAGVYRDGGLVDYHIDQPLSSDGIVLMPHFAEGITPGWFDKFLPWRRGRAQHTDNLLLLSPSERFLARLPNGKVPDRKDFFRYAGDDAARMRDWRRAIDAGRRLADDFRDWLDSDDPAAAIRPLQ